MGKLKIKFQPLFALYCFVCIYFNWFNQIFFYVITVTFHEWGHYFVANHYGYKIDSLIYSLSGAGITTTEEFKNKDEIKIAIAGPLINVFLILIIICLWWIFPLSYLYTYDFLICNLVVLFFNLLPIYPLDGGRIIMSLVTRRKLNKKQFIKINRIFCLIIASLFFILFVISLFFKFNLNLLITSLFLTINGIFCDKNQYYDKIKSLNKSKLEKPIEIKVFRVAEENEKNLIKYIHKDYISIFENEKDGKVYTIREEDLLK